MVVERREHRADGLWIQLSLSLISGVAMALALPTVLPGAAEEFDPAGHWEWVAWVGLVPVLWALERARTVWRALLMGFVGGTAFFWLSGYWVGRSLEVYLNLKASSAALGMAAVHAYLASWWAASFAIAFLIQRSVGWGLWMHMPFIWAAAEYGRGWLWTGAPWENLGYTQSRHLAVMQVVAIVGVYGLAALLVFVNCAVLAVLQAVREKRALWWKLGGATIAGMVLIIFWGAGRVSRLEAQLAQAPMLRVGLVQGNIDRYASKRAASYSEYVLDAYLEPSLEADRRGAQLVLWPEGSYPLMVPVSLPTFAVAHPRLVEVRFQGAHLLLGGTGVVEESGRALKGNVQFLLAPNLDVVDLYWKQQLLPFGEYRPFTSRNTRSGEGAGVMAVQLRSNKLRIGALVCWEILFADLARKAVQDDADILVNPTNESYEGYSSGPLQSLAVAQVRAVETGRPVLRPSEFGPSAVVLPTGRIQAMVPLRRAADEDVASDLLVAEVPTVSVQTTYTQMGDIFVWGCCLYVLFVIGAVLKRGGRRCVRELGASLA